MAQPITTEPFRLPRSVYERYVAMRWLKRRWWLLVVPAIAAATVSVWLADYRWLLVSLMYIFIVTPGIISMAYFRYLLTPEARLTAIMKRVVLTPDKGIDIVYIPQADGGEDDWLPAPEHIGWSEVEHIRIAGANYVIELKSSPYPRFIILPRGVLDSPMPFELLG